MEQWLAQERLEEARSQARLLAVLQHNSNGLNRGCAILGNGDEQDSQYNAHGLNADAAHGSNDETVQVVDDEDELTTIRRPVLPDLDRGC